MNMKLLPLFLLAAIPFCASSAWREGFKGSDTLHLVGEGKSKSDLPQVQREAMAREAAVVDALSHWPKYCGEADATEFRVENQKKRSFRCDDDTCNVRVVIEKKNLKKNCAN